MFLSLLFHFIVENTKHTEFSQIVQIEPKLEFDLFLDDA